MWYYAVTILIAVFIIGVVTGYITKRKGIGMEQVLSWAKSFNWRKWMSKDFLASVFAGIIAALAAEGFDLPWLNAIAISIPTICGVILKLYDVVAEAIAEQQLEDTDE